MTLPDWLVVAGVVVLVLIILALLVRLIGTSRSGRISLEWEVDHRQKVRRRRRRD